MKPRKTKSCKICQSKFTPFNSLQRVCSATCAIEDARHQKRKQNRRELREFNQKDKSYLMKKAQEVFNRFIRLRDGNTCVSCGNTDRQIHAGHYRPVGRNHQLRFNEMNCHSQCSICNNHLSGNLVAYREALIALYGEAGVQELEDNNEIKSYSAEELQDIIKKYKNKLKELK